MKKRIVRLFSQPGFVSRLVSCFGAEQTDDQLVANVNAAFGTDIVVQDFTNVMRNVRSRRIDTTKYVDCGTKNNLDLVQWAISAYQSRWGYVMGTFGQVLTVDLLEAKLQQLPDAIGPYEDYIRANYLGVRTADCIGLIKGYSWYDPESGNINYGSNGMPDVSADQIYAQAAEKGSMATMPEIPGILVHAPGHIGIYIGNGYAIEAMGTRYGVVKTAVASLSDRLSRTSGKKVYGYLKADVKAIVDEIVAELAEDERIKKLYDLWYEQREDVLRSYTEHFPERIPLGQNKEFNGICE